MSGGSRSRRTSAPGYYTADHPYMSVLEDVEHRAEHAQVWVAEAAGQVMAAVTLTFAGQPYSEIATHGEQLSLPPG